MGGGGSPDTIYFNDTEKGVMKRFDVSSHTIEEVFNFHFSKYCIYLPIYLIYFLFLLSFICLFIFPIYSPAFMFTQLHPGSASVVTGPVNSAGRATCALVECWNPTDSDRTRRTRASSLSCARRLAASRQRSDFHYPEVPFSGQLVRGDPERPPRRRSRIQNRLRAAKCLVVADLVPARFQVSLDAARCQADRQTNLKYGIRNILKAMIKIFDFIFASFKLLYAKIFI